MLLRYARPSVLASTAQTEPSGDAVPKHGSQRALQNADITDLLLYHDYKLSSYYAQSKTLGVRRHKNNNNNDKI